MPKTKYVPMGNKPGFTGFPNNIQQTPPPLNFTQYYPTNVQMYQPLQSGSETITQDETRKNVQTTRMSSTSDEDIDNTNKENPW